MQQRVSIIPLGPAESRVDLQKVIRQLNQAQSIYAFELGDALNNLPPPSRTRPDGRNFSPQYDPDQLFKYIADHRDVAASNVSATFGIVDSEVFDDLYSTVSRDNSLGLVSLRVTSLPEILRLSHRTKEQYVELEIGAQLLAMQYRRRAGISADPTECAPPWHIERRDCLFDYFGLSPLNIQKIMAPRISQQVKADFIDRELPGRYVSASMAIVKRASTTRWTQVLLRLPDDGLVMLCAGGILGLVASMLPSADTWAWAAFLATPTAIVSARVWRLKRR